MSGVSSVECRDGRRKALLRAQGQVHVRVHWYAQDRKACRREPLLCRLLDGTTDRLPVCVYVHTGRRAPVRIVISVNGARGTQLQSAVARLTSPSPTMTPESRFPCAVLLFDHAVQAVVAMCCVRHQTEPLRDIRPADTGGGQAVLPTDRWHQHNTEGGLDSRDPAEGTGATVESGCSKSARASIDQSRTRAW